MNTERSKVYLLILSGFLVGLISLIIPLLRDLHWESAGLASLVAAFMAGWIAAGGKIKSHSVFLRVAALLIGWVVPLFFYALFTHCLSFDGIAFWLFGPIPSMLFGWAIGRLVHRFGVRHGKPFTMFIILLIGMIPVIVEFLLFPQLYFFNHVWSYWPGPIYDQIVSLDSRLIAFRSLTIFWVITLWGIPDFFNEKICRWAVILGLGGLLFSYLHTSNWGFIAPEQRIQAELGGVEETDHFRIFYTSGTLSAGTIDSITSEHEQHLREITDILEVDRSWYTDNKIHAYIYHDQDQKKWLTGAGQTSYVPVWIDQDQMHIAREHLNRVLRHELVHIVSKQFGNWFGASTSIGLVEGVAVALDPDRRRSSVHQLVAARDEWPDTEEIRQLFNPIGFYSVAGPISYVISGSFVLYLLDHYPVDLFKDAYRSGNLEDSYPMTLDELTSGWHQFLAGVEYDDDDQRRAVALFTTPSIFELPCPRVERKIELEKTLSSHAYLETNQIPGCH